MAALRLLVAEGNTFEARSRMAAQAGETPSQGLFVAADHSSGSAPVFATTTGIVAGDPPSAAAVAALLGFAVIVGPRGTTSVLWIGLWKVTPATVACAPK